MCLNKIHKLKYKKKISSFFNFNTKITLLEFYYKNKCTTCLLAPPPPSCDNNSAFFHLSYPLAPTSVNPTAPQGAVLPTLGTAGL
jgi:hypothetical protein